MGRIVYRKRCGGTVPAQVTGLTATVISATAVNLSWSAAARATSYTVYRNLSAIAAGQAGTTYSDTGLTTGATYYYTVAGVNNKGEGRQSSNVSVTVLDVIAPTVPTGLQAAATSSSQIDLSWNASTDATGVTAYRIYRDGIYLTNTASLSHSNTGLSSDTAYSFTVSALDAAGNESAQSASAQATTQGGGGDPQNLFVANFATQNGGVYNFAGKYDEGPWTLTHLPTGSHSGGPAARITVPGGTRQFSVGWYTPTTPSWSPSIGATVYYRWRVRFADGFPFGSIQRKFLQFGSGGSPQSRCILYLLAPQNNLFGLTNSPPSGGLPNVASRQPAYFGVPVSSWSDPSVAGLYGSLNLHRGIGWSSGGPLLLTHAGNPSPYPPGPNAAAPINGWYHCQMKVVSSAAEDWQVVMWANCNNVNTPQQSAVYYNSGEGTGLGVTLWNDSFGLGVYHDEASDSQSLCEFSAVERGLAFDPNWYPG